MDEDFINVLDPSLTTRYNCSEEFSSDDSRIERSAQEIVDRLRNMNPDVHSNTDLELWELCYERYGIKKGDIVVMENKNRKASYGLRADRIKIVDFPNKDSKRSQKKLCLVTNYDVYPLDEVRLSTENETNRFLRQEKLNKFSQSKLDRLELERQYIAEGKDIAEIDRLEYYHLNRRERERKHCPPDDKVGQREQDLEL